MGLKKKKKNKKTKNKTGSTSKESDQRGRWVAGNIAGDETGAETREGSLKLSKGSWIRVCK